MPKVTVLLDKAADNVWLPEGVAVAVAVGVGVDVTVDGAVGVGVMAFGVPVDGVTLGVVLVFGGAVAVGTVRVVAVGKTAVGNVVWVGVVVVEVDAPSVVETLQEVPGASLVVLSGLKRCAVVVDGAL